MDFIATKRSEGRIIHPSRVILVRYNSLWKSIFGPKEMIVKEFGDIAEKVTIKQIKQFCKNNDVRQI